MFKQIVSFILLFHFIFYIGCASTLKRGFIYPEIDKTIIENEVEPNTYINTNERYMELCEILSLREKTIIIASKGAFNNQSQFYNGLYISELKLSEIESFIFQGKSKIGSWFKKGFIFTGAVATVAWTIGILTEDSSQGDPEALGFAIVLSPLVFLAGGAYGGVVGAFLGGAYLLIDSKTLLNPDLDKTHLWYYIKYPGKEPRILRELFPE